MVKGLWESSLEDISEVKFPPVTVAPIRNRFCPK